MEKLLQDIIKNLKSFFDELTPAKKISVVATFIIVLGVVTSMIMWASKTRYKVLYTNLTPEDSANVAKF